MSPPPLKITQKASSNKIKPLASSATPRSNRVQTPLSGSRTISVSKAVVVTELGETAQNTNNEQIMV